MARRSPAKRWIVITAACCAIEAEAIRKSGRHNTLSHATREIFQTDTRTGSIAFTIAWTALWFWFLDHILGGSNGPR